MRIDPLRQRRGGSRLTRLATRHLARQAEVRTGRRRVRGLSAAVVGVLEEARVRGARERSAGESCGSAVRDPETGGPGDVRRRLGDIIIGVAGKPVRVAADLYRVLDTLEVGQTIQIEVLKADKDKPTMLDVTLDGRDTSMM